MRHSTFVASGAIRHAEVEGCRVILDLRSESYRALDQVGSTMWAVLTGEGEKAASLEALANSYEVDVARLETDLLAFANRCVAEGLIEAKQESPDSPIASVPIAPCGRPRRPGMLSALGCLLATRRAISRDGFRATYERYALLSACGFGNRLSEALLSFRRAENFFVARRAPDDCLLRSLSLYRFLREAGIRAEHVIGVCRFPFRAHAWVECEGAVLLDDRAKIFTPLARIGAAPLLPPDT